METKDIITIIGIIVSFLVGAAGLLIGLLNSRKNIFINSITSARIKYIQDIRNNISEYCGLFYRYKILDEIKPNRLESEKLEIIKLIDKLKYQIMLYLNPEDEKWDRKIIDAIENLRLKLNENPEVEIKQLITITQYLLKLEWEGAKLESTKGLIGRRKKENINDKYYNQYLKRERINGYNKE